MTLDPEAWRREWGRLLVLLTRRHRDVDLAEEALAEAYAAAAERWPVDGEPTNPAAWLFTAANRRAIDLRRRESTRRAALGRLAEPPPTASEQSQDPELRLLLLACQPGLSPHAQASLALRLALGLPTASIARLFLEQEATTAARLTRAKRRLAAGLPDLDEPDREELRRRATLAVEVLHLTFTAGYAPADGDLVVRAELAGEAIRLARLLARLPRSDRPETLQPLLALMLLQHSRRDARTDPEGRLVLLEDQDRGRWRHDEIDEGLRLLADLAPSTGRAEEFRLQALIASEHASAPHPDATDWPAIARHYAHLEALTRSPVVRLNRAVAVAWADGAGAGLALLEGLEAALPTSHRVSAVRAELLIRAGRRDDAVEAYLRAIDLCGNEAERRHLRARLEDAERVGPPA